MRRREFISATAAATTALAAVASLGACTRAPIEGGFTGIDVARGHAMRDQAFGAATPTVVKHVDVVIAGGGIAGLAAARALRLAGVDDFALLELEDTAGGNSRGGSIEGVACPLGAHYLPVPGETAFEVQDLLEELGLRRRVAGRWEYDERHLCHAPQERLYDQGEWRDGLLPMHDASAETLAQYRLFSQRVDALRKQMRFAIPAFRSSQGDLIASLDAQPFSEWLDREGLTDARLRWYLEYCCRDDYGAGIAHVSAWAGIHYFASRHGFHAPGDEDAEREPVLTWPEGNAWLAQRLAGPTGDRLKTGQVVTRIAEARDGVEIDAFDVAAHSMVRWRARRCIVALPIFIAARVVESAPERLREAARSLRHAPWLVANLHVRAPLADKRRGAAPSWDNVVYGSRGLGYVDAMHQSLDPTPRATVLTWYRPLGPSTVDDADGRRRLLEKPWSAWRDELMTELSVPHPDVVDLATRIDITRYGHAMAMPTPGLLGALRPGPEVRAGRLSFAHADWSGYSIFEEAFTRGHLAGAHAANALGARAG